MNFGVIALSMMGRFGNQCFQYAFARAYAEKHCLQLQTDPWIGQRIFGLTDPPITAPNLVPRNENDLVEGEGGILFRSYCQQQKCLIYTKQDCLRWFRFQPWVHDMMKEVKQPKVLAHRRVGDYPGYGFTFLSLKSYADACLEHSISEPHILTEESPVLANSPSGCEFLPDFYLMTNSDILLRGNSSFSWWAATLNKHGTIYSPVIDGLSSGEKDVKFVLGNHPRLSHHSFCTELHLKE